ncbi:hypothetical protein HCH15_03110 [Corynebacterium testudinoris]|uniref:Uncharacterized protein n=1 Tax=Corynebacterium testudinoris TaxID=136857 RepID=A0A0G3H9G8_9CORY|nr:hypothetical protein [Corynebacterium testudinoris]AKK09949.1 hypothetical protein CTEST_12730 [Corynebacterium testudinoris]MBX8995175.1 hypothetical protein [Corynebacterium testudinoris]
MAKELAPGTFDAEEAGTYLTGILKRQVESECPYFVDGQKKYAVLSTEAVWVEDGLFNVLIRVQVENTSALVGWVTELITSSQSPMSFEHLNAHLLWSGFLAGDNFMARADFNDPEAITWINLPESFALRVPIPHSWTELLDLRQELSPLWINEASSS